MGCTSTDQKLHYDINPNKGKKNAKELTESQDSKSKAAKKLRDKVHKLPKEEKHALPKSEIPKKKGGVKK